FLNGLFVWRLVRRESFLAVVLPEVPEELEEARREISGSIGHNAHPPMRGPPIRDQRLNIGANGRASKTARIEQILSPRTRYHSQLSSVPAGVFVTMSVRMPTLSPSTNARWGWTSSTMWSRLHRASH